MGCFILLINFLITVIKNLLVTIITIKRKRCTYQNIYTYKTNKYKKPKRREVNKIYSFANRPYKK